MFKLSNDYIKKEINTLLCSYDNKNYVKLMASLDFMPQTFTVADKINKKKLIHFGDIKYMDWLMGLVNDQLQNLKNLKMVNNIDALRELIFYNINFFLHYKVNNISLSECIYNQEFIDIIRRIIYFTIYGNNDFDLYTAKCFNDLAFKIMPNLITLLDLRNCDLLSIFKLSIISGLIGLDMKGAPSAASNYVNAGIPIKKYFDMDSEDAAVELLSLLDKLVDSAITPVFYWDKFENKLFNGGRLVWMTDDYIESFFDFYFIMELMKKQSNLTVEIIPKNGCFGNDLSYEDAEKILHLPIFSKLFNFYKEGRLSISCLGPQMGAANITKLSDENIDSILNSDIFITKGCRIHEMLQGGLSKECFSAFVVVRELSEITTGFNSKSMPIILLHLNPKEYAFWGIEYNNSKDVVLSDNRVIRTAASTLKDHEQRKKTNDLKSLVNEFNLLQGYSDSWVRDFRPIIQEQGLITNKIYRYLSKTYKQNSQNIVDEFDKTAGIQKIIWKRLNSNVDKLFQLPHEVLQVLDIMIDCNEDLKYKVKFFDNGIQFINQKNSPIYIDSGEDSFESIISLPYIDEQFNIVHPDISFGHLPVFSKYYSIDLIIQESYRVLKNNGLFYILLRKGEGYELVDMYNGLKLSPCQHYTNEMLQQVLERNSFAVISIEELIEQRETHNIVWLLAFAVKQYQKDNS